MSNLSLTGDLISTFDFFPLWHVCAEVLCTCRSYYVIFQSLLMILFNKPFVFMLKPFL